MAAASLIRTLVLAGTLVLAACSGADPTQADASPSAPDAEPAPSIPADDLGDGKVAMVPPVDPADPSPCNAPAAQRFIGREADERARSELASAVAPVAALRWVAPGDATTEDYSPQRLNVMLDLEGAIASVHCG